MSSTDRFEVLYNDVVVGTTSFELGDPPMGVAFGKFTPTSAYRRDDIVNNHLLSARVASRVVPSEGIGIEDAAGEMEVTILGVPYPLYEQLFPGHIEAYEALLERHRTDLDKSAL